jgi:hypothetical protein
MTRGAADHQVSLPRLHGPDDGRTTVTRRSTGQRAAVPLLVLATLLSGCTGGPTSEGACEERHPDCVDEDMVDVAPPAEPSS